VRRHSGWGLLAGVVAAIAVPLASGADGFALGTTPAGEPVVIVADVKPPPPVVKADPGTPGGKPPTPVSDRGRPDVDGRLPGGPAVPQGCGEAVSGLTGSAPAAVSPQGVAGTTTQDLQGFAQAFNDKRVANCLPPIPPANFRYDQCMEARLFWMAEDPSTDPASAWGHVGSVRSDGVPSVGCDGNLAGGMNNTGDTVARKWWDSIAHRTSLYKPSYTGSTASVCIYFAMTHGGVPDEPTAFVRAAARWASC
jgi:hypothetical protein